MATTTPQTEIINPYDGSVIDTVAELNEADVRETIGRAAAVAGELAAMPAHQRAAILNRAAALIGDNLEALARLMSQENGKPVKHARGEVSRAVETFQFAADEARRIHGETIPMDAAKGGVGRIGYYVRVPVGIIAAITPFNFPLNLVAHKVAPAIAAGCPIVLKPAPATPLSALRLAELLLEAGLPQGAFSVVTGGADVGAWLISDPRVAMITFTGSPPIAHKIMQSAGVRRVTLELGGNAAAIIDEDANVDHAVGRAVAGGFAYSGQVCNSVQRIYIHRSRFAEFRDKMAAATNKLVLGNPMNDQTDIGPVINEAAAGRIMAWIQEAVSQGAKVVTGGKRAGQMVYPTIIEDVDEGMQVMCAEVFGPVVAITPFDDFDAALAAADNSPFGLQAGVYTRSLDKAMRAVQRLNVGGIMINDVPTFRVDQMPYGGNKESGIGREGPRFAIEEMTTLKMVVINPGV